ncbi:MAG TPA: ribonuclease R [Casimicrobiaceae bacterium]|nr:ribonuclease R [Casimicrobiaceae bacterium]
MSKTIPLRRRAATEARPAKSRKRSTDSTSETTTATGDAILRELTDAGTPLAPAEVATRLGLTRKQQHQFDECVAALERDGKLLVNRKGELCIVAKLDLTTGTVQGHPDGYGFLVPDNGGDDLFLSPREMHKALHGDRVTAKRIGFDRRGRPEGEIVDVLKRANRDVVGRIHEERGVWFVEAENRRINQDLMIPPDGRGNAQPGQVVVVEIVEPPSEHREAVARVKEVLGSATDSGIEIEIALRKHALPFEWSAAAKRQAQRLPKDVRPADSKGRTDLTHLPLVTIDGETAKDFDDAVYCEPDGRGFRLIVAIADVSHYVRDGDALDQDARERGTSVYFPRRVIPMLPEALSNELCSLKPDVDRLCVACDMRIDARGEIKSYTFYPATMHSRARLTYTQVHRWLTDPATATSEPARSLLPHLAQLHTLYKVLFAARDRRGAIDFDTVELALEFDAHGKIVQIVPAPRNDAHRLIEECMLAANVCAADFLAKHEQPALYRIHDAPPPDKLAVLREFLGGSALTLTGGDEPSAMDYAALIDRIRDRPDFALLQTVLLRSLSQAQYSPNNVGHFGLAYDAYAHFTSPIRRYPDLLVHRAIKAVLAGKREPRRTVPRGEPAPSGGSRAAAAASVGGTIYTPKDTSWEAIGLHCSQTERRADEASRDVLQWLKCFYMQEKVGETFSGTISGVASFGIFVTLDGLDIDGLVHVTDLPRDYFHFDAVRHALIGERTGRVFQLAARVSVNVARVDLERAKIDFTLDESTAATGPQPAMRQRPAIAEPLSRGDRARRTLRPGAEDHARAIARAQPRPRAKKKRRG